MSVAKNKEIIHNVNKYHNIETQITLHKRLRCVVKTAYEFRYHTQRVKDLNQQLKQVINQIASYTEEST